MEAINDETSNVVEDNPDSQNKTTKNNQSMVKVNSDSSSLVNGGQFNNLNLFDEKQLVVAENFLTKVMRSDKSGIKTVADGLAILMRAQDLNIPFSTAIEHIHVINNKTGIDIHIAKALLSKAACYWDKTKDYQALYEYTDGINVYCDNQLPEYAIKVKSKQEAEEKLNKDVNGDFVYVYPIKWYADFNGNVYKDYQLNSKYHRIVTTKQEAVALVQQKLIGVYRIPAKPIDYVTEFKFRRIRNGIETSTVSRFSFVDAQTADLFTKDTYIKYARILIEHRAWTYGARDIASDILLGSSETTELKIVNNVPLNDGDFIEVDAVEI